MRTLPGILLVLLLSSCFGTKPEKTGLEGTALPSFSLLLPDSTTWFNTSNVATGKASVLFLFSPHCPYCKKQMKEMIKDMDKLKDVQLYVITAFPFPDMKKFYQEFQLDKYNNVVTGLDTAGFTADYFEATGVPYTAIYDRNKQFKEAFMGQIYPKQILAAVNNTD